MLNFDKKNSFSNFFVGGVGGMKCIFQLIFTSYRASFFQKTVLIMFTEYCLISSILKSFVVASIDCCMMFIRF